MRKKFIVHPDHLKLEQKVKNALENFDGFSEIIGNGDRNVIKIIEIENKRYAIKSFKIPNIINQFAYRFLRKSKAERSYIYANKLLKFDINTPSPIAYLYEYSPFLFKRSYYVCELIEHDLTYRELTTDFSIHDHADILRAFTRFTFKLHQNGVNFLDHSPGNTLIQRNENEYNFYLVDLNRMKFGEMDLKTRVKNFAKLTIHKSMVEIMSDEYAKCIGEDKEKVFELMWKYTREFQHRFYRKIRIKKRLFFWKSKYKNKVSQSPI